jgi:hypothetical protein
VTTTGLGKLGPARTKILKKLVTGRLSRQGYRVTPTQKQVQELITTCAEYALLVFIQVSRQGGYDPGVYRHFHMKP